MSEYLNLLITVLHESNSELLRCALRVKRDHWPFSEGYYSPRDKEKIRREYLPLHVRSCGPVVEVEEIFECVVREQDRREG